MPDDTSTSPDSAESTARVLRVLEAVTARRMAGEDVTDESVVAAHPELMPELGQKLEALHGVERARKLAAASTILSEGVADSGLTGPPAHGAHAVDWFHGYEVRTVVGRGAMGVVYKALQKATQREVAIKVMVDRPFAGHQDRTRFEQEARILGQLRHPNIVTVYDTGLSDDRFFIVMDYIEGEPLDAHLAKQARPLRYTIELFEKICDAVGAAHLRGVIHRDLKPSNIRIDADGEPHVLDFGLAKSMSGNGNGALTAHSMTMTGQFVGSLPWASPEQAEGDPSRIDLRTDVYSLGVILYQMVTGRFPYPVVGNIRDVVDHILRTEPRTPGTLTRHLDNDLETIVLKCLTKEPSRRYQSAVELARDVRHYLSEEPIEAKRDSSWYVLKKMLRRYKMTVSVVASFLVLLMGFSITMAFLYSRAEREAERAGRTLTFLQETLFEASSQRLGADATLREVLDVASHRVGTELVGQPVVAAAVHYTIGHAYDTLWRLEDAVHHLRMARDLYQRAHGPEHPDTVRCTVMLGMVLAELGSPEAVALQEEALAIRLRRHGKEHILVANSQNELAYALWRAAVPRRWCEAEVLYKAAIGLLRKLIGPEHRDIARSLQAFAAMYQAQGRFEEAEPLYRESLSMSRKLLGDEHQFVLECMVGYAVVLQGLDRFEEANSMMRHVLAVAPQRFGQTSAPRMLRRMADLHLSERDLLSAQRWFHKSIAASCRYIAETDPSRAEQMNALAAVFAASSDSAEGDRPYTEALMAIAESTSDRQEAIEGLIGIAKLFMARQRFRDAADLLQEAVQRLEAMPDRDPAYIAQVRAAWGHCLMRLGRYEQAETALTDAHITLRRVLGARYPATVGVLRSLVALYEATDKPDRANEFRVQLPPARRTD